jgi:DNA-binding response OmpR family regulator
MTEPLRVLVADDDEDVLVLVSTTLERAGYAVTQARDGTEALRLAEETRPALCIFDVMMPGMNGLEVTRRLRAGNGHTAGLRIMLLTASVQDRHRASGLGSGANDFVRKPFSPRELIARIERLLAA